MVKAYVRRSEDCAIPVGHEEVLWIFETVRTSFYSTGRKKVSISRAKKYTRGILPSRETSAGQRRRGVNQRTCTKTLLALLKFLEKPKIPGNFGCGHLASF